MLEHPAEAFAYYRHEGVPRVICEQKHMGSRAVAIVCRDGSVAKKRFGVVADEIGIFYKRTRRRFFDDEKIERALLERVKAAVTRAGFWEELKTDWVCLDCELMPWSAKARALLQEQYAPVGVAAETMLGRSVELLEQTSGRGMSVEALLAHTTQRKLMADAYVAAYRHYCWPVSSVDDLKLAPFHLLCDRGPGIPTNRTLGIWIGAREARGWHLDSDESPVRRSYRRSQRCSRDPLVEGTNRQRGRRHGRRPRRLHRPGASRPLLQPAVKCRGPEYLRIIYGPEHTSPKISIVYGHVVSRPSVRLPCGNLRSASKAWNACEARATASGTRIACSACSLWC